MQSLAGGNHADAEFRPLRSPHPGPVAQLRDVVAAELRLGPLRIDTGPRIGHVSPRMVTVL